MSPEPASVIVAVVPTMPTEPLGKTSVDTVPVGEPSSSWTVSELPVAG